MHSIVLRRALAPPLQLASLWSGHALRRARAVRRPRILMYHSVGHEDVSIRQFRWQLRFLRDTFDVVPLTRLVDRLIAGTANGEEVALSFDDGVRNHYSVVWPLLRDARVPATFFVCPGLIESGAWLWNTELRVRLSLLGDAERARLALKIGSPKHSARAMVDWAKQLALSERQAFEERVRACTRQFEPTAAQLDRHAPMSWSQLARLDAQLIGIGSHTATHPILSRLPRQALHAELVDSRRALEQRLGRSVDLFCYPNGDHDHASRQAVREVYRAALSTREDVVTADADVYTLPRVPAGDRKSYFVRRLHRPAA
ncbi:MAG TPA: polysaccharide deacetylase family protein [Rhodanobacteraceae bacterium]|nr:polysaccharide deacetylase family protein [Rhodanobacteraceae bacterium]